MSSLQNSASQQQGMTLVELMISMVISLVLMAGVYQSYLGSRQAYRTQEGLSHLQESARFALAFVTEDIRMADVWGCVPNSIDLNTRDQVVTSIGSFGYDPTVASAATSGIFGVEGGAGASDAIFMQGIGSPQGLWSVAVGPSAGTGVSLLSAPPSSLATADNVVISNCGSGNIATVSNISGSAITLDASTLENFDNGAMLYPVHTVSYSIGPGLNGRPALLRTENGVLPADEIIPNVVQMQIQYNDGRPAGYVNANVAAPSMSWATVDSVRVSLTLETPNDNIATENQRYTVIDNAGATATVVAADRRLYRSISTVIDLRGN